MTDDRIYTQLKIYLIIALFCVFFSSCFLERKESLTDSVIRRKDFEGVLTDTLIKPFNDTTYSIKISYKTKMYGDDFENNTIIKLTKDEQTIFVDSIKCDFLDVYRKDMNNDGLDDILILHSNEGGRANPTYYLFLLNSINSTLNRVYDFETLPNPDIDRYIITSVALAGTSNIYKFYQIKNVTLINLGHSFETSMGDSTKYQEVIRLLENKR